MNRCASTRTIWAAALLLSLTSVACKKDGASQNQQEDQEPAQAEGTAKPGEPAAGGEPIVIAMIGPLTGQYATFGHQMAEGAKQAVADLNAAGGVLGRQVQLELGDDACDPKQAVAVGNQMVQKGAVLIDGHFCSGSSIPASKVYEEEGVLMISPGSTNPKLTDDGGDNVFRVCGRDDQQGMVAAKFLAERYRDKKIAVVHDKTAYGQGLADETKKNLEALGVQPAMYEAYTAGEKDYTALVSKLKQNNIDVLYVGGYHTEAGLIMRQMREQGMSTVLMSGDAMTTEEYWSITGEAGEGTLMTFSPDPRKNPKAAPVVEAFRAKKIEPEGYVLYSYGAIQAWAQAVTAAGTVDLEPVIKAMRDKQFDTVLGTIEFDDNGDVTAPGYVVYVWKGGTYEYEQAHPAPGQQAQPAPGQQAQP